MSEFLKGLNPLRHFKDEEFTCKCGCEVNGISKALVFMLDNARELAKIPFKINSGFRCVKHNKKVGGVKDSSHVKGLAVDIACDDEKQRFIMLSALLKIGFKRILIYDTFIHVDIDLEKFNPILQIKK